MNKEKLSWDAEVLLTALGKKDKKSAALQRETGMDRRRLMKAVNELRHAGFKVCSGNAGYHLWDGKDDTWNETKRRIRSQAIDMMKLSKAMDRSPAPEQLRADI